MPKIRGFLELVRIPGVFTAQADILAGWLLVGISARNVNNLLFLLLASACFYGAGMALNDAFDAEIDARQRPKRPIPSGRVSLRFAFGCGFGLLVLGLVLSRLAGLESFVVAVMLAMAIITYDGGIKHLDWFGPINMGACRYLNLLLGLSLGGITISSLAIPLLTAVHIFGVTRLSRLETEGNDMAGIVVSGLSILGVVLLYGLLRIYGVLPAGVGFGLCMIWAAGLGVLLIRLIAIPSPGRTQQTIKYFLMGLVILDGVIVAGHGSVFLAIPVWTMLLPTFVVSRKFYVT